MEGIAAGRSERRGARKPGFLGPVPAGAAWFLLGLAWILPACRSSSPPPASAVARPSRQPVLSAPVPEWIHQPLSWDKLAAIAAWLEGPGRKHAPDLVIEGELQLNEGRVLMTAEEADAGIEPTVLRTRADSAIAGFESVLSNQQATSLQKQRAETGKRAAQALLETRPTAGGPALVARQEWSALEANARRMTPATGHWQRITVHHSAESSSRIGAGSLADSSNTIRLIQKYHMQDPDKLWGDIGYHFLIDSSGRVFAGRDLRWQGAHAGGANNRGNIGICVLGEFLQKDPQPAAIHALETLIEDLRQKYGIPRSQVFAHNELGKTACPGPWLTNYLDRYAAR